MTKGSTTCWKNLHPSKRGVKISHPWVSEWLNGIFIYGRLVSPHPKWVLSLEVKMAPQGRSWNWPLAPFCSMWAMWCCGRKCVIGIFATYLCRSSRKDRMQTANLPLPGIQGLYWRHFEGEEALPRVCGLAEWSWHSFSVTFVAVAKWTWEAGEAVRILGPSGSKLLTQIDFV